VDVSTDGRKETADGLDETVLMTRVMQLVARERDGRNSTANCRRKLLMAPTRLVDVIDLVNTADGLERTPDGQKKLPMARSVPIEG